MDVRLLIPEQPDSKLVYYSSYSYLEDVKGTGIKIYRYQKGFMHQKVVLMDDDLDRKSFPFRFSSRVSRLLAPVQ